jgi:hypothetical protein
VDTLTTLVALLTCVGAGVLIGLEIAFRLGPHWKWRIRNNCHCGERRAQ